MPFSAATVLIDFGDISGGAVFMTLLAQVLISGVAAHWFGTWCPWRRSWRRSEPTGAPPPTPPAAVAAKAAPPVPPAAPPPVPPAAPPPVAPQPAVPAWQIDRARQAGSHAREKLQGRRARVPQTPGGPPLGAKTHFVFLRTRDGDRNECSEVTRGIIAAPWVQVEGHAKGSHGGLLNPAVFHGFHSMQEARAYWDAATLQQPVMTIAPRPFP